MNLTNKEILANRIFGENANEVLVFLEFVAPDKKDFRSEESFLNFIAKKLEPKLKKKARYFKQQFAYWDEKLMEFDPSVESSDSAESDEFEKILNKMDQSKQNADFWDCRAMSMDIKNQINKAKNVLWCIRLLNGKGGAPEE